MVDHHDLTVDRSREVSPVAARRQQLDGRARLALPRHRFLSVAGIDAVQPAAIADQQPAVRCEVDVRRVTAWLNRRPRRQQPQALAQRLIHLQRRKAVGRFHREQGAGLEQTDLETADQVRLAGEVICQRDVLLLQLGALFSSGLPLRGDRLLAQVALIAQHASRQQQERQADRAPGEAAHQRSAPDATVEKIAHQLEVAAVARRPRHRRPRLAAPYEGVVELRRAQQPGRAFAC